MNISKRDSYLKYIAKIIFVSCAFSYSIFAQSSVSLSVNSQATGVIIPDNFIGVSFGPNSLYQGVFDSTRTQIISIFHEIGIRYFRMGGTWVDTNQYSYIPARKDIDAFFSFVKAAGLKDVIYTLRLENGDAGQDASTAKYIWDNYKQFLTCFAIGNEPDIYKGGDPEITDYTSYLVKWKKFQTAILDSVPDAIFGGPDNTSGGTWAGNFARSQKGNSNIPYILSHDYVGGSSSSLTAQQMIDGMLSPTWISTKYPSYYNSVGAIALSDGYSYRLTEVNCYSGGSIAGGSNGFATALFALDFMHWWSEHGCAGVSVHTGLSNLNGAIYQDTQNNWQVYPWCYGIKAFDIGGHGSVYTTTITNPAGLNLTAYSVGNTDSIYVTIINKEHNTGARDAEVTITAPGFSPSAAVMYLLSANSNPSATTGMTLGGATIKNIGTFNGEWSSLDTVEPGRYVLKVPATSAAIVKIGGVITSVSEKSALPRKFMLEQNFPNPFNPTTSIEVSLDSPGKMSLKIFNVLGQLVDVVDNGYKQAGDYKYNVNMERLASGVYFYILQQDTKSAVKKMIFLK